MITGQQHHAKIIESETRNVNWPGSDSRFIPGSQQFVGRQVSGIRSWFYQVSGRDNKIDLRPDLVVDILHNAAHGVSR